MGRKTRWRFDAVRLVRYAYRTFAHVATLEGLPEASANRHALMFAATRIGARVHVY